MSATEVWGLGTELLIRQRITRGIGVDFFYVRREAVRYDVQGACVVILTFEGVDDVAGEGEDEGKDSCELSHQVIIHGTHGG